MGGLNTTLLIGIQALEASQGAINATSNNIANANTPGYTREVPQFTETPLNQVNDQLLGGGVSLNGLQSVRDELLNLQIQQQTSSQSSVDTQSTSLQQVQTYFTSTGGDIASALSSFSSSLAELSANSSDAAVQQTVLSSGQNLANAFNSTANGLTSVQSAANTQVTQTIAQINTLTTQIAQLNGQLWQLQASGQDGGTVQDQRDQAVLQLSQLTNIAVTQSSDGETITTGNGSPLVMGSQSFSLQTATGSNGMQQVLDSSGNNITASIQGGQLGGAIQIRDQVIPGYSESAQHPRNSVRRQLQRGPGARLRFQWQQRAELLYGAVGQCGRGLQRRYYQSSADRRQFGWLVREQRQCGEPLGNPD